MGRLGVLKPLRGTEASLANVVLEDGEIAFAYPSTGPGTGTGGIKMGNGTSTFSALDWYINGEGSGPTPTLEHWQKWVNAGGLDYTNYESFEDVLADESAIRRLMTIHNSVDYLVEHHSASFVSTVINNDYCAKWINLRDYALDTLYADSTIDDLMDEADKYFYGEWTIVDNTTTPPTWGAKGNVPIMTSNATPYGTASASATAGSGYEAYRAFDGNSSTYWQGSGTIGRLIYQFTNPVIVRRFDIKSHFTNDTYSLLCKYTLQGSNDGINWVNVAEEKTYPQYTAPVQSWDIDNSTPYLYYSIYNRLLYHSDGKVAIDTLHLYGRELLVSVPKMTSNTAPYGEAISSSTSSSEPTWKVFDKDITTYASKPSTDTNPCWIGYKFDNKVSVKEIMLGLNTTQTIQRTIKIQYSDDGSNYYDVTDQIVLTFTPSDKYEHLHSSYTDQHYYWRIYIISGYNVTTGSNSYAGMFTEIQFYGLDYSEYDWDTDNPRHYIYDHGVSVETVTLEGSATKKDNCIKLKAVNDQAYKALSIADYNLLRGTVGPNASGTNALMCGSSTASFSATNMPYNNSLDVSSISTANNTGVKQTAAGTFDIEEIWLE